MKKLAIWGLIPCMTLCLALPLHAKNSRERDAMRAQSKTVGLATKSVRVLSIDASRSRKPHAVVNKLRAAALLPGASTKEVVKDNHTVFAGDGWRLEVSNDGTGAHLRRLSPPTNCRPFNRASINEDSQQVAARRYIDKQLRGVMEIETDDELVPYKTRHELRSFGRTDSKTSTTEICSTTVTFSRRVGGVDVIGDGSKVQVVLDPDGAMVGWDFDWPHYVKDMTSQDVLDVSEIKDRARAIGVASSDGAAQQDDMECGFFDPGFRVRGPSSKFQAGCTIFTKYTDQKNPGGRAHSASVNTVPIGRKVLRDSAWPLAARFCSTEDCVD